MKTAHILNEILDKKVYIKGEKFDVDFFDIFRNKNSELVYENNKSKKNELFNLGLKAIEDKSQIVEYDKQKINKILNEIKEDEVLLVSGDFWGIQKFIFSDLTSKNAAKILRSRSAKIQLITKVISKVLANKGAREVLFGAGKFLMIAPVGIKSFISKLQKDLNNYFLKNYFGENGFILSYVKSKKKFLDIENSPELEEILKELGKINEINKLKKFDLSNLDNEKKVIDVFESAKSDDEICEFCKKRVKKIDNACEICNSEIELGKKLVKNDYLAIVEKEEKGAIFIIEILGKKYYAVLSDRVDKSISEKWFDISNDKLKDLEKWQLKSFVALNNEKIKTFEELQGDSSGLIALKADVDRLGKVFRDFYYKSFAKFNRLSRELNFFFANYIPYIIKQNEKYRNNIYVIFAGGDDLFLLGRYDVVVDLAKEIRKRFIDYTRKSATISMGLVMFKHNTPITFISKMCDEAESRAKSINNNDRDGIDIFGITMKFDEFLDIEKRFSKIVEKLKDEETTTFYYRLIDIIKMANNIEFEEKKDFKNALWKSKLNYASRNFKNKDFLDDLNSLIEEYGNKILPSLFLTIYKRRDNE